MSLEEFKKNILDERLLHNFVGILLPMIVFSLLFVIYQNETSNNLSVYVWVIPISYLIIFLVIYEGKFFIARIKSKNSEYFFKILTFERAIIRFEYIEKFQKYSIIAFIVITIFVSISIYFIIDDRDIQLKKYYAQQAEYEKEVKNTYRLSEDGLRKYFHDQISEMSTLKVDQRIVTILGNELLAKNENTTFAEFHQPGNEFLWSTSSDLDRRQFLHAKYDEMNYDELKKILSRQLEKLVPSPFIDGISNNTFIEFLFFVLMIPVIQVYVIFPLKYSLTKHSDFYYFIPKGCFSILMKFTDLDQMTKRKYLFMGLNYYEKFVKKSTNLNINRLDEIKSTCVSYDSNQITRLAHNFVKCLKKDNNMELLAFIQNKIQVSDSSKFLIHISLATKIKENLHIIATAISTLLGFISALPSIISFFTE